MSDEIGQIRVPKFSVNAGGVGLTAEQESEYQPWTITLPNSLGISPKVRLYVKRFDDVRSRMEELAVILAEAEKQFKQLHDDTHKRVRAIITAPDGPTE